MSLQDVFPQAEVRLESLSVANFKIRALLSGDATIRLQTTVACSGDARNEFQPGSGGEVSILDKRISMRVARVFSFTACMTSLGTLWAVASLRHHIRSDNDTPPSGNSVSMQDMSLTTAVCRFAASTKNCLTLSEPCPVGRMTETMAMLRNSA